MASMMGAIAFQKGLGVVHSCAHALGTVCDLHHGLANGIMIDHALPHNAEVAADAFARLATAVGLKETNARAFLGWLGDLKSRIDIPATLTAAGVAKDKLDALVGVAVDDVCHVNNPRPCAREDFVRIFQGAL